MPYIVQGNAQQIFHAFGQDWAIAEQKDDTKVIHREVINFLGSIPHAIRHLNIWQKQVSGTHFLQGNMTAGNLAYLFGPDPLKKKDERSENCHAHLIRQDFAYIDDAGEDCGLIVMYRQDDPKQWVIGLMKKGHAVPQDREIICAASFDLQPFIKAPDSGVTVSSAPSLDLLLNQLGSALPYFLLQNAVKKDNGINLRFQRVALLMRRLQGGQDPETVRTAIPFSELNLSALFAENPALDLILHSKILDKFSLPVRIIKDLLSPSSQLCKEILGIQFTDDERINKSLLKITIIFYEQGILEQNRNLLKNLEFIKKFSGFMWNETQIKLLPFLIQQNYPEDLIRLILSNEAYYQALDSLVTLEPALTEDVPEFFKDPKKLEELNFIHSQHDDDCKRICLIFWVKGFLSADGYQQIIDATNDYPLLASTLVALDQTKTYSIQELERLALAPRSHLNESIRHHFEKELKDLQDVPARLRKLKSLELEAASKALLLLRKSGVIMPEAYHWVLNEAHKGQALRLFLPQLEHIEESTRKVLIEVLYAGVINGIPTQGKRVLAIKDSRQLALAKSLGERFICVRQMQDLKLKNEMVELAAIEESEEAQRFRHVIMRVEAQCKIIHERLSGAVSDREMLEKWKQAEESYRKTLYSITYKAIMNPEVKLDVCAKLKIAENKILDIVDPKIDSDIYKAIIVLANIVISVCSLLGANGYKYHKTGNFWFFNQTRSGEEIRALDKEILQLIEPEKTDENGIWSFIPCLQLS
ncbi:hypothetical protein [Fluoribacter gormanii]|uniref:Uncharacterized protein n=1 Tax=Fluoribacter gormanii TaxID=464 RepID=A0A377GQ08_9GAMM|nr:hypothetical protein [Fluoribacter gormanii]KTD00520.1 hypothetical protein Lgor_2996 [Fluoribacter gormanii]SIR07757.1 hypothetical protein SAMN05421777_10662 [Fluoribacter gormanii]STO26402.1 Uncharacterised protein [Fluoribacter gormanii]